MKKLVFFLLFFGTVTTFFYCSKKAGDSNRSSLIQKTPGDNNLGRLKADDGGSGGSPNCNCGSGYASCSVDCLFSACCVCWDPKKSEGACGCYFGIAKCKTALIGANSFSAEPHSIKVYHRRFEAYLEFLKDLPSDSYPLQEAFKTLVKFGTPDSKSNEGERILVNENKYDDFYKSYTDFINALPEIDKALIIEYINRNKS